MLEGTPTANLPTMSFVHLHCHSEYSLLDGANRIDDLIRRAKEFEQPAVAITDHGNLHAAWEFQEKAKKAGLKPIIGMEAYVATGSRRERARPAAGGKPYYHLVLLARDAIGYKNLIKLSSLAYTEGFYTKPRVDRELLAQYSEGIIVSSACLAGEVAQHLMANRMDAAREAAAWYAEVFKDRYYLEVQAHTSEGQTILNSKVFSLASELGLPGRRHERLAFPSRRRPRRARRAALHRARQGPQRSGPHALRSRPVLQELARDRVVLRRAHRRPREHRSRSPTK